MQMRGLLDWLRAGTARNYITTEEAFLCLSRHAEEDQEQAEIPRAQYPAAESIGMTVGPIVGAGVKLNKDGTPRKTPGRKPRAKVEEQSAPNGAQS